MIYFYWNYWTCECIVIPLSCDYSINCLLEVVPYWDRKYYKLNCLEFLTLLHIDGLTHWGRVTYICISKLTIIGSDKGLSPGRRQAIIWTSAGILLIRTSWTNFNEVLSKIAAFSFKKIHLKMSAKWCTFCLGLNLLMQKRHNSSVLAEVLCLFSDEAINIIQSNENQNWVQRWVFVSYRYENLSIHSGNG